jgi:hypothetical protein
LEKICRTAQLQNAIHQPLYPAKVASAKKALVMRSGNSDFTFRNLRFWPKAFWPPTWVHNRSPHTGTGRQQRVLFADVCVGVDAYRRNIQFPRVARSVESSGYLAECAGN